MARRHRDLPYHTRKFHRLLQACRIEAGLSQLDAAKLARITPQRLSRIETQQLSNYAELLLLLDMYETQENDRAALIEQWETASARPWWADYRPQDPVLISMQDVAARKREFQPSSLPSLLQTEGYASRLLRKSVKAHSTGTIENLVKIRTIERERLYAKDPLQLRAFIPESVLCDSDVDRRQILKIAESVALPNVTLQIIPRNSAIDAVSCGSMTMLSFGDDDDDAIAYVETVLGRMEVETPDQLFAVRDALSRIEERALSPEESVSYIENLAS